MNKIRLYKKILIGITIVVFLLILIFTIDVIRETPNRSFLDIDFQNKDNIVSAYGSLIGGILAFLSILFVLFGLLEQRQQILNEKAEKEAEYAELFANPYNAAARGFVDEVIEPKHTREKLIKAFDMLKNKVATLPKKKHGNIPL